MKIHPARLIPTTSPPLQPLTKITMILGFISLVIIVAALSLSVMSFLLLMPHVGMSTYEVFRICKTHNNVNDISSSQKMSVILGASIIVLSSLSILLFNLDIVVALSVIMVLMVVRIFVVCWVFKQRQDNVNSLIQTVNTNSTQAQEMYNLFLLKTQPSSSGYFFPNLYSPFIDDHKKHFEARGEHFCQSLYAEDPLSDLTDDNKNIMEGIRQAVYAAAPQLQCNDQLKYYVTLYTGPQEHFDTGPQEHFGELFKFLSENSGAIASNERQIEQFKRLLIGVMPFCKFDDKCISLEFLDHLIILGVLGKIHKLYHMHYCYVIGHCGYLDHIP
jgi:hypothetical protein